MAGGTMKEAFLKAWKTAKEGSPKRKFTQSGELIITLKDLDIKKQDNQIDVFLQLPHATGKKIKLCALVGPELAAQAKEACDTVILAEEFKTYKDKKVLKKLAEDHDHFIAQANIMADVAKTFGKIFGPKGKMPNPKAGCVVPPNANIKQITDRLRKLTRLLTRNQFNTKSLIGKEDQDDAEVVDNCIAIYNQVLSNLPGEKANIKSVLLKTSMGKPVKVKV